ncbi:MAG: hypothetical protein ACTS9Y_15935 [Methylophilus sp.]|uniref:hypothetical protein n=1 Tax=Methylophilus sp. TaxID=29541 RepID=UPI003F9EE034
MGKQYMRWLHMPWLATSVTMAAATVLTACVTINIYFPAAAAEKAADKVIDEIWQTPAGQTPAPTPNSSFGPSLAPAATPAVAPAVHQESAP